eukprot:scaffold10232_cov204-Chaetoceros_neogracile.AAC.3
MPTIFPRDLDTPRNKYLPPLQHYQKQLCSFTWGWGFSQESMKEDPKSIEFEEDRIDDGEDEALVTDSFEDDASTIFPSQSKDIERVYKGLKNSAVQFDRKYMQVNFGGINRDNVEDEFEVGDFELEEINSDK